MQILSMLLAALLPVGVLIYYIYWKDRGKPEPVWQLVKAFLLGVMSAFVSLFISSCFELAGLYPSASETYVDAIRISFFGASIPEELAKFAILLLVLRKNPWFDEKMDGIVYAVCVSMGFAAFENLLYVFEDPDSFVSVGIARALLAVPGHFLYAVLMGYYYSMARFYPYRKWRNVFLAIAAPILAHGLYDSLVFGMNVSGSPVILIAVVLLYFCFKLWKRGIRSIREHLERDADTGM